mmetsp:Transcript_528/g.1139  ORF Transcript_528/g.1139 Transcript_528/m.1139 type:complete len:208 (-) Transcript_528:5201-5824(-)
MTTLPTGVVEKIAVASSHVQGFDAFMSLMTSVSPPTATKYGGLQSAMLHEEALPDHLTSVPSCEFHTATSWSSLTPARYMPSSLNLRRWQGPMLGMDASCRVCRPVRASYITTLLTAGVGAASGSCMELEACRELPEPGPAPKRLGSMKECPEKLERPFWFDGQTAAASSVPSGLNAKPVVSNLARRFPLSVSHSCTSLSGSLRAAC